jgi:transcriptional regulator with XRE-family HTH domain
MMVGMELTEMHREWGRRVRRLRREKELKAVDFAREAGIARNYLHRIEGGFQVPSDAVRIRIATALGVDANEIFSYDLKDAS